jgi:tetratricopeptide (TPR) repeat protein
MTSVGVRMKRRSICIALDLLLLCSSGAALAAGPEGNVSEASAHFNRGVELYREGNLDAALAEFLRANELAPNYRLLYNMAQVQSERHDYVRAIELLSSYLQQGGAEISAARRQDVEQEAARLRQRVGMLWVSADAENATLWINDERAATLPLQQPVLLNAGIARVRVEADGRKPYATELNVAGGDRPRLQVALEIAQGPAAAAGERAPKIDYTPVWVSGISTATLGLSTVVFGALTSHANSQLSEQLDTFPGDGSAIDASRHKVRVLAAMTDVFGIATLLAAGTGVYFLVSPSYESGAEEKPAKPGADIRVSAGFGSVAVEGSF